eukprot:TRINITY_DN3787_c0_g1_i2.p1 TRINITY_DN3787_c0_g1~~TRINITY_DN3787_c0_g1_i2.p1  ORF type:complete len:772 (+),score=180.79 TRINITY_DN3787_c0_g1_i2:61-2316(+)
MKCGTCLHIHDAIGKKTGASPGPGSPAPAAPRSATPASPASPAPAVARSTVSSSPFLQRQAAASTPVRSSPSPAASKPLGTPGSTTTTPVKSTPTAPLGARPTPPAGSKPSTPMSAKPAPAPEPAASAAALDYNSSEFSGFRQEELDLLKKQFDLFDADRSGEIDEQELVAVLKNIGEAADLAKVRQLIAEVDTSRNGQVSFAEFVAVVRKMRAGHASSDSGFGAVVKKTQVTKVEGAVGSHSFSDEEKEAFVEHINSVLADDPHVGDRLPLNPTGMDLFKVCDDGIMLIKLVNDAVPGTIDMRAVNLPKQKGQKINAYQIKENNNLLLNSCKGIGCAVVNIGSSDLQEGQIHLVLGLIWQIIKIGLLSRITLNHCPELFRLLEPGEELSDLLKLSPEEILIRWFNYHLRAAGHPRRVTNFGPDIKDSECYTVLLHQLKPNQCDTKALAEKDTTKRAEMVLDNAGRIGCRKYLKPKDIVKGNRKLNLAFVANLFNTHPCLEPLTEEEKAKLDDSLFNGEGSREARAFALWMNSLGCDPFVNNLFDDLRDGLILLQIFDKINPGCVDWKKVNTVKPLGRFKAIENCQYAITIGKSMNFSLVGIGGSDIVDGQKTLTLGLVWQMMRFHVVDTIKALSKGGREVKDEDIVAWANGIVATTGKEPSKISNFKDATLKSGLYLLNLLEGMKPGVIDFSTATAGTTEPDAILNAKYAISVARKLGATIFLLPEDIYELQPKLIMTLVGSLMGTTVAH